MKTYLTYLTDLLPKKPWQRLIALLAPIAMISMFLFPYGNPIIDYIRQAITGPLFIFFFIIYPIITTMININQLRKPAQDDRTRFFLKLNDLLTILFGGFLTSLVISLFINSSRLFDWQEQIFSYQIHSPIWTPAIPTLIGLVALAAIGYIILAYIPLPKCPPLLFALGLSLTYLTLFHIFITFWQLNIVNFLGPGLYWINLACIYLRLMAETLRAWQSSKPAPQNPNSWQGHLDKLLRHNRNRHWLLLLLLLPILGLLMLILSLWGQEPDYLIKLWTETSEWTLSTKVSPPSIEADQHYLCTVGAQGHRKIVKPIRKGVRHGKPVIVNRQLLIANAFEDLLAERFPKTHRFIRQTYDRYGYPISKHIKQAWQADLIYVLMKPAEWFFLTILYLCDSRPENRIALQYITQPPYKHH